MFANCNYNNTTRRAPRERKLPSTLCHFFPLCSPGVSTIRGRFGLSELSGNGKNILPSYPGSRC